MKKRFVHSTKPSHMLRDLCPDAGAWTGPGTYSPGASRWRRRLAEDRVVIDAEEGVAEAGRWLIVCINYGGRAEIVDAANAAIARDEKVTEETFRRLLYAPDVPDPDLIIRTGGAHRPGDFLLWQSAYSAYRFTDTLWPDFSDLP